MIDPDDTTRRTVTLRFAAQPEHLVLARLVLTGIAVAEGLSSQVVSDLKLAVTEACTNAIEHAYAGLDGPAPGNGTSAEGQNADVTVRYITAPGTVTIEVCDRGAGFDPEAVRAEKPAPDPGARDGGMGLSIIDSLVDELAIAADGSGTRITFSKRYEAQSRA